MRKWTMPALLVFLLATGLSVSGCVRNGCPAEIQAQKVKKKKNLSKSSKTNLFPRKMQKNLKSPKF